jgi:carbonic anhydrase
MDFRFQDAIHDFATDLRVEGSYDFLTIPGVAKNLSRPDSEELKDYLLSSVEKSSQLHEIAKVIIINHQDCGGYEQFEDEQSEKVQHFTDLKKAGKIIEDNYPELKVKLYFANIKEKGNQREIDFEEVK